MKTRIILTVLILVIWIFLSGGLYTADVIVKNNLAVATVNGGNDALLMQNAYEASQLGWLWIVGLVGSLIAIWTINKKK